MVVQSFPAWAALVLVLAAPQLAVGCMSSDSCDYPYNNPFTTQPTWNIHSQRTDFPGPCCAVMPGVPQINTGGSSAVGHPWNPAARLTKPPSMEQPSAHCPPVPDDIVVVPKNLPGPTNGSVL